MDCYLFTSAGELVTSGRMLDIYNIEPSHSAEKPEIKGLFYLNNWIFVHVTASATDDAYKVPPWWVLSCRWRRVYIISALDFSVMVSHSLTSRMIDVMRPGDNRSMWRSTSSRRLCRRCCKNSSCTDSWRTSWGSPRWIPHGQFLTALKEVVKRLITCSSLGIHYLEALAEWSVHPKSVAFSWGTFNDTTQLVSLTSNPISVCPTIARQESESSAQARRTWTV
jgi:hypothetical protein